MKFYNKIGLGNYYDKSIYEKVDLLLKSGGLETPGWWGFDIADYFKENFEDNILTMRHNNEIAKLPGLYPNPKVLKEIYNVVLKGIINDPYPQTINGCNLIDKYQFGLLVVTDNKSKIEAIKDCLKKTVKLFSKFINSKTVLGVVFTNGFDKQEFFKYIYEYYNIQDTLRKPNSDFIFKLDVITHLCPPAEQIQISSYESALDFMVIKDFYCHIEFLKKELLKCQLLQTTNKETFNSGTSISNIKSGKKKLSPLQLVCYIDMLRTTTFATLEYSEKLKHLNNITGGENFNIESQLDALEKLIALNGEEYEELMKIQKKYSEYLCQIVKVDDTNTRKAIRKFKLTPIPKEKVMSEKDKKYMKEYNKASDEIRQAINNIDKYFG